MMELYFPTKKKIWCIGEMMHVKEVPAYAYRDFWSLKPKYLRWLFKLLSYVIAIPAAFLFQHADTVAVYKDARIRHTFRDTDAALEDGANVIIFPERVGEYNEIVNEFQDKFVDVARLYDRKHGKRLAFVPMYIAPRLHTVTFGSPIYFDPEQEIEEQRAVICSYLQQEITRMAKALPRHVVVPYDNVRKREYPISK